MTSRIERVHAREVFDSRGKPTVEVEVTCAGARPGRAMVPSGASTGRFEAVELRDRDASRLDGLGVRQAVRNVCSEIATALIGLDADDQAEIDRRLIELDGTSQKSRLGANAILGASLAVAYASAEARGLSPVARFREIWSGVVGHVSNVPTNAGHVGNVLHELGTRMLLPLPMVNMISGGLHAGRQLEFQDFLILPVGATSYSQAFEWIVTVYRRLGRVLTERGHEGILIGDEGGYGPKLRTNEEAIELVVAAIEAAGLKPGDDVAIGLDVASTHFFEEGRYRLPSVSSSPLTAEQMVDLLDDWVARYPIISLEDPLAEDDWDGWQLITERLGERVQLIGDDLFVTNVARLREGIERGVANSVLIKLNQIGTLSETLETLKLAIDNGYWPVVSARSGETEDATIADLVVATGAGQLKVGSVARSERLAKYNQLLRLEESLGSAAGYLGGKIFG
ncbi:MAG: phosphopyruvate hydratase [Planctomycetaceae bacterium]